MRIREGVILSQNQRIAVVLSRFNGFFSERLLEGALDALKRTGGNPELMEVVKVPGAFEIPMIARKLALSGRYDGILCLGVILRGETPHFDLLAAESTKGLAQVAMDSPVPLTYGLVTADTEEQAMDRSGVKAGNKGYDAALALFEMINLYHTLEDKEETRR